jgi:hypothetical protein
MLTRLTFLGLLTAGLLQAETFRETSTESHPLDPHASVRIGNTNGTIEIRAWDRPEVSIQVEKHGSSEDYLNEIQVVIDADPHALSIKTIFPHHLLSWLWNGGDNGEVRLTLMVPATVDLSQVSLVNGAVTIDGVHGAIDVHTVNGGIHATGLGDDTEISTVNGGVHAEVAAFGSGGRLHITTVNGGIAILLAKDTNATFDASTINGGTSCELPIRLEDGGHHHGMHGVIGAGGGSITASTVNGGIHLQAL